MQVFGLLALLITLAVGVWVVSSTLPGSPSDSEATDTEGGYAGAIESAEEAAQALSGGVRGVSSIEVYDGISVSKNETILDLSGRGLDGSLKAEVRQLSQLEVLDLSNNNFTGLPAEVGQLSKLQILNLSNNPFTGLPYELGNLSNLEVLDVRGTQYAEADLATISESLPATTQILTD